VVALLGQAVAPDRLVVAIDPGKVESRVWLSTGERGLIGEPQSLPTSRAGLAALDRLVAASEAGAPLIALEQTGALHRAWQAASSSDGRERCGCSRRPRPRQRAPSWDHGG
jgi:hypothetical protein